MKEPNKPLITKDWKNRLELMQILTKLKVSESVHLKVEGLLKDSKDKEKMAKKIVLKINKCTTEEEIIQKLSQI